MAGGPAAIGPRLARGSGLYWGLGLPPGVQLRRRLSWPRGPGLHSGSGLNSLAASILHGIEVPLSLGTQMAVGSHLALRTPDMCRLVVPNPGFSRGKLPGSLSPVHAVLLVLLTPV